VRPNPLRLARPVPDVYGVSARVEIPEFAAIRTHHVSSYIKMLMHKHGAPTVKQYLTAMLKLFAG
jgi:hypothetical protein